MAKSASHLPVSGNVSADSAFDTIVTFLLLALFCELLTDIRKRNVRIKLEGTPSGLDRLYERMLNQISDSDDADLCKYILSVMMTDYLTITHEELASYIDVS
ncbi:uncharacterized protein N7503_006015 [Penicillium pulvis]|uniref:uncharacterized protein n=1 Tax=Penicillium pulvis TaxID=1562058 RepID=UPI0025466E33|nr:uncharacterized protein N7503_006015 [Penicillium pulvis]KAJ5803565.1 hypothetical protein N7503_006015 [Penicillium pulvis]